MFERGIALIVTAIMVLTSIMLAASGQGGSAPASHGPIYIEGDSDFTHPSSGVTSGSGTASDPYIIESYDIWGAAGVNCIEIRNTSMHFVIRDCSLQISDGVVMAGVSNGTVTGVTTYACGHSVRVEDCSDILISINTIGSSTTGVKVNRSENVSVVHNQIDGCSVAVDIDSSEDVEVSDNHSPTANVGLKVQDAAAVTAANNTYNWVTSVACSFQGVRGSTIADCTYRIYCAESILATDCSNCSIRNNEVTTEYLTPWEAGYGILVGSSDNVTVEGNTLMGRRLGIQIEGSDRTFVVGNHVEEGSDGILDSNSTSSFIANNTLVSPTVGVRMEHSDNSTVIMNDVTSDTSGIVARYSGSVAVVGNTVVCGDPWLSYAVLFEDCNESLAMWNDHLSPSTIHMSDCFNMTIFENELLSQGLVSVQGCDYVGIMGNVIHGDRTAVSAYQSEEVYVMMNTLLASEFIVKYETCMGGQVFSNVFPGDTYATYGVCVLYCSGVAAWGNEISNCESAIGVTGSTDITVFWNEINSSGLNVFDTTWSLVYNNTFVNGSGLGLYYDCEGTQILENSFLDDGALSIYDATGTVISENVFERRGIGIWGLSFETYDSHLITDDNTVNGKPILQVKDCEDMEIRGETVGQLFLVNSLNVSVSDVDATGAWVGMTVAYCLDVTIDGCTIADNQVGLKLVMVANVTVHHNWFTDNDQHVWREYADADFNLSYPGGGNYWSDYAGDDLYHGPEQDISGPDGFGDTPYSWYGDVLDYYPIVGDFINYAPTAAFTYSPVGGTGEIVYSFDASASSDDEDPAALLEVRWDWDGDGTWDSDWSSELVVDHAFGVPGTYDVHLEVRDSMGSTDDYSASVTVEETAIPEFGDYSVLVTLTAFSLIVLLARRARRRRPED